MNRRLLSYQPDEIIPPEKKKNNKFATAGLILGAAGIVLLSFNILSIAENIVGIIFSVKGLKSSKRLSAGTGLAASIICLLVSVFVYIYNFLYLKK